MFGAAVRWSQRPRRPRAPPGPGRRSWRCTVCRALAAARGVPTGVAGPGPPQRATARAARAHRRAGLARHPRRARRREALGRRAGRPRRPRRSTPVTGVPRTLVVVGDLPEPGQAAAAVAWARRSAAGPSWPSPSEGGGPTEAVPHGPLLLGVEPWLDAHAPERVVTVGRTTLARPVARLLRRPGLRVETVERRTEWTDPATWSARCTRCGVLRPSCRGRRCRLGSGVAAGRRRPRQGGGGGRAAVARAVWPCPRPCSRRRPPPGRPCSCGSSNAVRDLDLVGDRAGGAAHGAGQPRPGRNRRVRLDGRRHRPGEPGPRPTPCWAT